MMLTTTRAQAYIDLAKAMENSAPVQSALADGGLEIDEVVLRHLDDDGGTLEVRLWRDNDSVWHLYAPLEA